MSAAVRRHRLVAITVAVVIVVVGAGAIVVANVGASASSASSSDALGPGPATVTITIDHSRFDATALRVRPHTEVRFVLVNRDPIAHELIIGGPDVHARHANGHEASHPPVDGEVSVTAEASASTTYVFHEPGAVEFACHLPGHYQYGMRGVVDVVAPVN